MKITYVVMPTSGPVRFIDSGDASATRRAIKLTLKNLKRWCVRLRYGTAARNFKNNQQNQPREIKIPYNGNTTMTMIVDQEESRNRANENLENELRESLANNDQPKTYGIFDDADVNLVINGSAEDDDEPSEIYPKWTSQEFFEA